MTEEMIKDYILSLDGVWLDQPFGDDILVYEVGEGEGVMMALMNKNKQPVRLSLRCDETLSKVLREKYDEVMPGEKLDTKYWNTLVLTGQLTADEIEDLIKLSYQLALKAATKSS